MERIIKFLSGYTTYIIFVFCLILSSIIIMSNETSQVAALRMVASEVSGIIASPFLKASQVISALDENEQLKADNMRLYFENSAMRELQAEITKLRQLNNLKEKYSYNIVAGSIIAWGDIPIPTTITIDRGLNDGVKKNDPVLSSNGLVGKVLEAGPYTSICQLLTDRNFKVMAKIRNRGTIGLLQWKEDEYALMQVVKRSFIQAGDTVITSELGNIYPVGIPIGIIDKFEDGQNLFKDVQVKLFVDYFQLKDVAVLVRERKEK